MTISCTTYNKRTSQQYNRSLNLLLFEIDQTGTVAHYAGRSRAVYYDMRAITPKLMMLMTPV